MDQKKSKDLPPVPEAIGRYRPIKYIGVGGMGEIFLAKDPISDREVAIKRIKPNLYKHQVIRDRFLREAKTTAALNHPSIVPIYEIHQSEDELYYVMPYIEGKTFKEILNTAKKEMKRGELISIAPHIRTFMSICQAISYCHTKGYLHRDLKPDNIIVGQFGQVQILDWGLAEKLSGEMPIDEIDIASPVHLTKPGKVIGTLTYMAPERVHGKPSGVYTDIYSLGVILYLILTLRVPFVRRSIKEFKKSMHLEKLVDAIDAAPYREIPPQLSKIAKRCLAVDSNDRYDSVESLIRDLEGYSEGHPEWTPTDTLDLNTPKHWEFLESVLLGKQVVITRSLETLQWVVLAISKKAYTGNIRLAMTLTLEDNSQGVGLLLCVPEPKERKDLEDGFCVWFGTKKEPGIKIYRNGVELASDKEAYVTKETKILIEKIDHKIEVKVDDMPSIKYISPIPIVGSHVGMIYKDTLFSSSPIHLFSGSQRVTVNCLSIPDAFLAAKQFDLAFSEYNKIADSFRGRPEGREAIFRGGITLIEKAKSLRRIQDKKVHLEKAHQEFERLSHGPGAPLEYLGKSLVYRQEKNLAEELKCLELSLRRYPKHPLIHLIEDQIVLRFYETTKEDRLGAHQFALLITRHLPHLCEHKEIKSLVTHLSESLYSLPLFPEEHVPENNALKFAFWLGKKANIKEFQTLHSEETPIGLAAKRAALLFDPCEAQDTYDTLLSIEKYLLLSKTKELKKLFGSLKQKAIDPSWQQLYLQHAIWSALLEQNTKKANTLLNKVPKEDLSNKNSYFYFLQGCFLGATEGSTKALDHLKTRFDTPYPPLPTLAGHYLWGNINLRNGWIKRAFPYEKAHLYRQLSLYYLCIDKRARSIYFEKIEKNSSPYYTLSHA